jgi:hypothetical protein
MAGVLKHNEYARPAESAGRDTNVAPDAILLIPGYAEGSRGLGRTWRSRCAWNGSRTRPGIKSTRSKMLETLVVTARNRSRRELNIVPDCPTALLETPHGAQTISEAADQLKREKYPDYGVSY